MRASYESTQETQRGGMTVHEASSSAAEKHMKSATSYHVCITTCFLLPFCCSFPPHLLKQKRSHDHRFFFAHVRKAYYRLHREVDEESSLEILRCLISMSCRFQCISDSGQMAKASILSDPEEDIYLPPTFVFLVYKVCGPSILRNNL